MTNKKDSKATGHDPDGDSPAAEGEGRIVIEATWAPKDPRDRLYDEDATASERTMSLIRVIAAFHPVLNSVLLVGQLLRRMPRWALAVLLVITAAGLVYLAA
ncbi:MULTISPECIES: hypothetical protein [Kordiimonas]|jgi:hypothetical protein|uniref:hypothetical protein n=1 Tax=Kordiimonas TaxID=288021 RepID=UPI00257AC418|nr:hypothetical protein [Kordiimonas sp. UBA4487]